MPITYQIDQSLKLIVTRCFGKVTLVQVIEHFRELQHDPHCPSTLDVLLDLTECDSAPSNFQLHPISNTISGIREKVQFKACAIVVSTDLMFGMSRMFLTFAEERFERAQVFRQLDKAKEWLTSRSANRLGPGSE
jgi:hypothetical protein